MKLIFKRKSKTTSSTKTLLMERNSPNQFPKLFVEASTFTLTGDFQLKAPKKPRLMK